MTSTTIQRKPFWAACTKCGCCWPAVYLPMEMGLAARIMARAACPSCGATKEITVAKQDDGVLALVDRQWRLNS